MCDPSLRVFVVLAPVFVMNPSPTSPARHTAKQTSRWLLEIVRGREVGRAYALDPGETVLGNALNGQRGLDLLEQEGSPTRRMAGKQRHASDRMLGTGPF